MERVELVLTTAQLRKFQKHQPFQVKVEQLKNIHTQTSAKHHVEIMLNKKHYGKLLRNVRQNKGFRFTPEIIQGGDILGDVGGFFDTISKPLRDIPAPIFDKIVDGVKDVGSKAGDTYKATVGVNPFDIGFKIGNEIVGPALDRAISGKGLKKGSPEMKAKMAKLRAMRKTKNGGGMFDSLKSKNSETYALPDDEKQKLVKRPMISSSDLAKLKGTFKSGAAYTQEMVSNPYYKMGGAIVPDMKAKMARLRARRKPKKGTGMWDWIDPNKNGVSDAFNKAGDNLDPSKNGFVGE